MTAPTPPTDALGPDDFERALREALERHGMVDRLVDLREGFRRVHDGQARTPKRRARTSPWRPFAPLAAPPVLVRHADPASADAEVPATWAEASEQLLPRLRPTLFHALQPLLEELGEPAAAVPHAQLSEDLCVDLALESPSGVRGVDAALLDRWEVPFPDALAQAGSNLGERSRGTFRRLRPGLLLSTWEDAFHPSRMLFPRLFDQLPIEGDPIALPLDERILLVSGSDETEALAELAVVADSRAREGTGAVSLLPLVLRRERWRTWSPPRGHPAREPLRRIALQVQARRYEEQGGWLERLVAARGRDIAVVPLELEEHRRSGGLRSVATWRDGRAVALPHADRIRLVEGGRDLGTASWREITTALEGVLHPFAPYPERKLGPAFPEPWQRASLSLR